MHSSRRSLAAYTYRVLIAVAVASLAFLLWQLSHVLMIAFGGVLLAAVLRALSDPLDRITPLSSRLSLLIVVIGVVVVVGAAGWLIGGQVARQLQQLADVLPGAIEGVRKWMDRSVLGQILTELGQIGIEGTRGALSRVASVASSTFGAVANTLLIVFLGLYLAADPSLYRRGLLHLFPPGTRVPTGTYEFTTRASGTTKAVLGVRPEHIAVGDAAVGLPFTTDAEIEIVEPMGSDTLAWTTIAGKSVTFRANSDIPLQVGQKVRLGFDPARGSFFDAESTNRL